MRPFACLYTTSDGIRRMTKFDDEETFQTYVAEMTKGSTAYIEPEQEVERMFSFVTCSYEFDDARTIMYAYEVPEDGEELADDGELTDGGASADDGESAEG